MQLAEDQAELSFGGGVVGPGIAPGRLLFEKFASVGKLVVRTYERLSGRPYRDSGGIPAQTRDELGLFVTAFERGSVAVRFQLGRSTQLPLPGVAEAAGALTAQTVLEEVVECLSLVVGDRDDRLRARISDDAYHRNFMALAKQMMPDGKDLTYVALSTGRSGRSITLRARLRDDVTREPSKSADSRMSVVGRLLMADATGERGAIRVVDADMVSHRILVPEGLMSDIVKPLWESMVEVVGNRKGKVIWLTDIKEHHASDLAD